MEGQSLSPSEFGQRGATGRNTRAERAAARELRAQVNDTLSAEMISAAEQEIIRRYAQGDYPARRTPRISFSVHTERNFNTMTTSIVFRLDVEDEHPESRELCAVLGRLAESNRDPVDQMQEAANIIRFHTGMGTQSGRWREEPQRIVYDVAPPAITPVEEPNRPAPLRVKRKLTLDS